MMRRSGRVPTAGKFVDTAKWLFLAIFASLGFVRCTSPSAALTRLQDTGVLRVAVDPSFPPFEYIDERGEIQGFDADLARHLAHCLKVEARLVTTNFDGLYDALTVGRADVIISGLYPDPFRTKDFVFSEPYFNAGDVLVTMGGRAPGDEITELVGKRIAVVFGTSGHMTALRWEERLVPPPDLVTVETADEALSVLEAGDVEVSVMENLAAQMALRAGHAITLTELPEAVTPYVVAARRENGAVIEEINRCLAELGADGTLDALADRWFVN